MLPQCQCATRSLRRFRLHAAQARACPRGLRPLPAGLPACARLCPRGPRPACRPCRAQSASTASLLTLASATMSCFICRPRHGGPSSDAKDGKVEDGKGPVETHPGSTGCSCSCNIVVRRSSQFLRSMNWSTYAAAHHSQASLRSSYFNIWTWVQQLYNRKDITQ